MENLYHYLFYCFYSIMQEKEAEKIEGAVSLLTVLFVSIIFSFYFLVHVWFDLKFFYPMPEIIAIAFICLIVWGLNRKYFINKGLANQAVKSNVDRNKGLCKLLGILLTIGQLALFISSGIVTSKHVWGW